MAWTVTTLPLAFYIGRNINLCSSVNAAIKLNRLSVISCSTDVLHIESFTVFITSVPLQENVQSVVFSPFTSNSATIYCCVNHREGSRWSTKQGSPYTGLTGPSGFQEDVIPRISRKLAHGPMHLPPSPPQGIPLVLISLRSVFLKICETAAR